MAKKFVNNVNEKNLILTRAQGAVISRDFPTAARLYKQLLKDDPSNVDYLKELGSIYVKNGEDAKAIPYYEQIITFYPHYIDAMTSLGAIYRRLKRYEESISILERAIDEGRQSADVNYNLGFTYREMGNYDDAIEAFSSVVNENPSDVLAYNHLGAIYLEKKEYEKSIAAFKRGLQIDQNHPILNYNLARCFSKAKMYSDSIRCFENALKAKPGWVDAIKDFSNLLVKCQKSQEASDLVKHSIELYPNDTKLLSMLGNIYLDQYDYDSAEKTFKRAKKVDDQDIQILVGLSEALEKGEKPQEALETVLDALEISPDDKDLKKRYVQTLLSANQIDAAGTNVKELYSENKEDPQVLDLYGQYLICHNEEKQAEQCFKKINDVSHNYKSYLLSAADRYNQIGKTEEAEHYAKEFVAYDMRNPDGYNMLGKIYSKGGNLQQAIDSYDKSRNLRRPNVLADRQIESLRGLMNAPAVPEDSEEKDDSILEEQDTVLENEEVVENAAPENETENEPGEEGFDFGTLGDNVPMQEALKEDEGEFFDDESLKNDEEVSPYDVEEEPMSDKEKLVGVSADDDDDSEGEIKVVTEGGAAGGAGDGDGAGGGGADNGTDVNDSIDTSAGFAPPPFTGDGEREENPSVSEMLDNVDSDSFDFDQFDETSTFDDSDDSDEFDINKMPDPFHNTPPEQNMPPMNDGMPPAGQMPPQVPPTPAPAPAPQTPPPGYDTAMMDAASMAMDTVKRANELAQQNAQEQAMRDQQRQEQMEQMEQQHSAEIQEMEQQHAEEMDAMRRKVEELEKEKEGLEQMSVGSAKSLMSTAENLLPTIERILADDDSALENAAEIELFKKLLELCQYLPEIEKENFLASPIRMKMEYLISKMSGIPGLLKTALSLKKTGVLDDGDYANTSRKDFAVTNHELRKVFKCMKVLSDDLDDTYLADAMCNSIDFILEKIELAENSIQIF